MQVRVNGAELEVELLGEDLGSAAPLLIAHHGGGGIGSLAEPRTTFGPLARGGQACPQFRVLVFDARGCGRSEAVPPYSHAQWVADVDALREWAGAERCVVAGGSYGGFIALEYALAHPDRVQAVVLRDTSPDSSNLALAYENACRQDRVAIDWDHFDRYWQGRVRSDAELKALWAELIGLYDHDPDPARAAAAVEAGIYRHEAHNWCFQHNMGAYDLKPRLGEIRCPVLVTVGRHDWVTPVAMAETIVELVPDGRLVVFEQSGHSPQVEERDAFLATVSAFLDEVVPAPS